MFFPSSCAKLDETGEGVYRSLLSQCSPKTKALKFSVIIVSLEEEIFGGQQSDAQLLQFMARNKRA